MKDSNSDPGPARGPLLFSRLQPISDKWEASKLQELCRELTSWKDLAAVFVSRGYMQTMRAEVCARVALLAVIDPVDHEVPEEDQTSPGAESLSRRGITRK